MPRRKRRLVLGQDYIIDESGRALYTREYLDSLGECCNAACDNCPWEHAADSQPAANSSCRAALTVNSVPITLSLA